MDMKVKENRRLRRKLESLNSQIVDDVSLSKYIEATEKRISAYEAEMTELKERLSELESVIEEQGMQIKCGKSAMGMGMVNLMGRLSMLVQNEIADATQESEKKRSRILAKLQSKEEELLAIQNEGKENKHCSLEALKRERH